MKKSRVAFLGLFTAFAMILSFVESQIPTFVAIPGIKLGLANIAIIVILYKFGPAEAVVISLIRVLLTNLLFGFNPQMLVFSCVGASLSFLAMFALKKLLNIVTVSVIGGICHNIGQIAMACVIMETTVVISYLPVLLVTGVIAGIIIGLVAALTYKKISAIEF